MLVRIRSKEGNFRFELSPTADASELMNKILGTAPDIDLFTLTISNQARGKESKVASLKGKTLQSLGIKHGDLLFVTYSTKASPPANQSTITTPGINSLKGSLDTIEEDPIDTYWRSKDGKIVRPRDPRFCKHGANGMCDHCQPLEPYDATYHKENNIKHISYHAYLRKLTPKTSGTSSLLPPLTPLSYRVKVPCPTADHLPWPAGICTSCQTSAITLQSQPFRLVDHLEIASTDIVDRFLQAWRKTGLQRFGWLIGHYDHYDKVPMGVKAVVEAIHEPPQEGEIDGLTLGLPWEEEPRIRELAKSVSSPLTIVGYIFTDLDPTEEDRTKTTFKRHPGSHFLSSLEVIFAATMQNANPLPSRSSPTGLFSSRLVTAVLTGTEGGQVDVSAYQVSEQACAMVDADMIEASVEPGIMRVKEEHRSPESARYVPDVFFRFKNEYGLEVKKSAKPCFPVEYLLVNVTHGFPQNPSPIFRSTRFPIENRPGLEDQRVEQVMSQLASLDAFNIDKGSDTDKRTELAKWLSDWHLVAFLGTTQLFSADDMKTLMRVASSPKPLDDSSQLDSLMATESWQMLMTFTRESARPIRPSTSAPSSSTHRDEEDLFDQIAAGGAPSGTTIVSAEGVRICPHCTFENIHGGDCDVCGLPLT